MSCSSRPTRSFALLLLLVAAGTGVTATARAEVQAEAARTAKTAQEILACHLEALGGRAALDALVDLRLEGSYSAFSQPSPFVLERQRPNRYRFETQMLGPTLIDGYDGTDAWVLNPLLGPEWPIPAPPAEAARILGLVSFDGPLVDAATLGHGVELAGIEDFEGEESYRLGVKLADGGEETWYLSTETCLPVGRDAQTSDFGGALSGRTFFSDYRPVGGVQMAHRIEDEFGIRFRVTEVTQASVNPGIPAERFAFRPQPEMEPLALLAGEWSVKVETRPVERAPWTESETTAAITTSFHGTRLEERIVYNDGLFDRNELRTLAYDRFRERFVLTVFDDVSMHPDRLEGSFADGKLEVSDLETGTAFTAGGATQHRRHTVYDIGPDGFKVDVATSTDAGATWQTLLRTTYSRGEGSEGEEEGTEAAD